MATDVEYTVGPNSTYADIASALAGEGRDITQATGSDERVILRLESGAGGIAQPQINADDYAWVTEPATDNVILVMPAAGGEHDGTPGSSSVYIYPDSANPMVRGNSVNLVFRGVRMRTYDEGGLQHLSLCQWDSESDAVYFENFVAEIGDDDFGFKGVFQGGSGDDGPYLYNGWVYGDGGTDAVGVKGHSGGAGGRTGRIYHVTFHDIPNAIEPENTTLDVRNCASFGGSTSYAPGNTGGYDAASSNNYDDTGDASARGIGPATALVAGDFEDPAAPDMRLAAGSALIDAGTDLSSAPFPITTDALGTARPQGAAYDVGAFEYVQAGDTTPPTFEAGPNAANVGETAFDVTATLDEDGNVYAIALADGASAPADGAEAADADAHDASGSDAAPRARSAAMPGTTTRPTRSSRPACATCRRSPTCSPS